ncbi:hypothetical protein EZ313_09070 [Ramlibacter henchirensis]|uniref:DUF4148 domain-containing protein n=1 Tax=Ramlibacter henchirensis TaxID=204072 RepID=A0A4Z0C703_9BURK|nr:hypothetical protein [Ramlibacter henchirensis]TFZ06754.1 hypothetical protein EZ313_09070 [Ramlibacter henchirensis]
MRVHPARSWAVLLLAGAMAASANAQAVPDNAPPEPEPGRVLSDAQPLPAEERDSSGAVLLENSRVRAQRGNAFDASAERTGITSTIGRNVSRVIERARSWNDVREADASQLPQD